MAIIKIKKQKTQDKIIMECGFGCQINIKTVDIFSLEEKGILFMKTMDCHNEIFHGLKPIRYE